MLRFRRWFVIKEVMSKLLDDADPEIREQTIPRRLSEQSWINAAVRHIAEANVDDIRIEELARELGVTKGSFYWHFRNRQHLLERVLEHWMDRATVRITEWSKSEAATGVERLAHLLALPANTPPDKRGADIELAVRAWARREKLAADMVAKIDRMRMEYISSLVSEFGFTPEEVRRRTAVAQAFMLGDAFLKTGMGQRERIESARACAEMIADQPLCNEIS